MIASEIKISLCMIVQDEEDCIQRALDNSIDFVDEVIVFDSGSTDNTLAILGTYPNVRVLHHPLEGDFSAQRNRSINEADGKWILVQDADETFERDLLLNLQRLCDNEFFDAYAFARKSRIDGYLQNIMNFDFQIRLFRNNGQIRYEGKFHESVTGHEHLQLCNLVIYHNKKSEWQKSDNERVWNMGQTPPPGWVKDADGKWQYHHEVSEHPHYYYPLKIWEINDRRMSISFDDEVFRQWYNPIMAGEQPALPKDFVGLNPIESKIAAEIKNRHFGGDLLDIGCGNGKFIISLLVQEIISKGVAIDIADTMVENAKQTSLNNGVKVEVVRSSLEQFNTDRRFDVIIAFEVLEHLYALRDGIKKIKELLKPGGFFAGSVPWLYICNASTHLHYFTEQSMVGLLKDFFKEVYVEKFDLTGTDEYHIFFWGVK